MSKKKTIEELEQAAKAAEKRAKELRAKARKITQAEEARMNAEIIKAVKAWRDSFPEENRKAWSDLPQCLYNMAEKNRMKYEGNEQGQLHSDGN